MRSQNICFIWKHKKEENFRLNIKYYLYFELWFFFRVMKSLVSIIHAVTSNKMPTSFVPTEYTEPKMNRMLKS